MPTNDDRALVRAEAQGRVTRIMAEAEVSSREAFEALGFAMRDTSPKVRPSMVRAAEILLRSDGLLGGDNEVNVDARTVLIDPSINVSALAAALLAVDEAPTADNSRPIEAELAPPQIQAAPRKRRSARPTQ